MSPRSARREPAVELVVEQAVEPSIEPAAEVALSVEPVEVVPIAKPTVKLAVSRFRTGDQQPHFDAFEVEVEPDATVLDALLQVRRRQDPSLVVRHSCLHGSCGTCGVRVNGREALACDTRIATLPAEGPIKVEPLRNQRVVADLATDMVDFYARFEPVGLPPVRTSEACAGAVPPDGIKAFGRFENCIECGLCLSACPIARTDRAYVGPAALAAAARVVAEPRGRDLGPVLALATEPDSVWRCRDAMECTAVCPSAVDPARALFTLRRHVAFNGLKRFVSRAR
jgi:succinate dehydrogenase / fumarate reductase iron-sulfur subunit